MLNKNGEHFINDKSDDVHYSIQLKQESTCTNRFFGFGTPQDTLPPPRIPNPQITYPLPRYPTTQDPTTQVPYRPIPDPWYPIPQKGHGTRDTLPPEGTWN